MDNINNKICVITGATSGIGRQTALQMAQKGYAVQALGRSADKCSAVITELETISPGTGHRSFVGDFEKLDDVRRLAAELTAALPRIDVLINNAGCVYAGKRISEVGVEQTLHTNHLTPFLFTSRVLPLVRKGTTNPRIVNVSSDSHHKGTIDFEDINYNHKRYFVMTAYERSKLANVLFTNALAKRLSGTDITVNSLHPGMVRTQIGTKNTNRIFGFFWNMATAVMGISEADGATTSVYLATSDEVRNVTGRYFDKCKDTRMAELAADEVLAQKLWTWSEEVLGESFSG